MNPGIGFTPELVWFRGPDAVRFLNDLISQEIAAADHGAVKRSLLLAPQGKLDFILWAVRGEEEVGLITEDGRGDELVTTLSRYRIRVKVEIEPEVRPMHLVVGASAIERGTWEPDGDGLRIDVSFRSTRRELLVGLPAPDLRVLTDAEVATTRILDVEPLVGVDVDETTIPQETALVSETISFTKGCFMGQELVARLDSRGGRVNHHLRVVDYEAEAVELGTELFSGERKVGRITTSDGEHGLALIWREVEPGDQVMAGDITVTVRDVPHNTAESFTTS